VIHRTIIQPDGNTPTADAIRARRQTCQEEQALRRLQRLVVWSL
jgi:hypothetical protein